jgi:hypothetical protein
MVPSSPIAQRLDEHGLECLTVISIALLQYSPHPLGYRISYAGISQPEPVTVARRHIKHQAACPSMLGVIAYGVHDFDDLLSQVVAGANHGRWSSILIQASLAYLSFSKSPRRLSAVT